MTLKQFLRKLDKVDDCTVSEAAAALEQLAELRARVDAEARTLGPAAEGRRAWLDVRELLWLFTRELYEQAHAVFVRRREHCEGLEDGPSALELARFYAFGAQAAGKLAMDAAVDVLPWAQKAVALADAAPELDWETRSYVLWWALEGFRGLDGWALGLALARKLYQLGKANLDDLATARGLVHLAAGLAELEQDGAPIPLVRELLLPERDALRRMVDEGTVPFAAELLAQIEDVFDPGGTGGR